MRHEAQTSQPEGLVQVPLCFFEFLLLSRVRRRRGFLRGAPNRSRRHSESFRRRRGLGARDGLERVRPGRELHRGGLRYEVHGGARNAGVGVQHLRHRGRAAPAPHALDEEEQRLGGFGAGRRGGDAARSPMAGASSVAEAARALVEAKRLDGERKCVSPAERCHRGVDAAGTATRVASGRMVNRVGRTATGHGRWTARAAVKPARIDLITGTRARHTPTIASPVAHRAMCAACRRSALVLSWIAGDIRKRVWFNWWTCQIGDP